MVCFKLINDSEVVLTVLAIKQQLITIYIWIIFDYSKKRLFKKNKLVSRSSWLFSLCFYL